MVIPTPRVFISFSHDGDAHVARVAGLANELKARGVAVTIDLDQLPRGPKHGWVEWMDAGIAGADVVLVVPSQGYDDKLKRLVPAGTGRGVKWEGAIIRHTLYASEMEVRGFAVVPVVPADANHCPTWLGGAQRYCPIDASGAFDEAELERLLRHIFDAPQVEPVPVGPPSALATRPAVRLAQRSTSPPTPGPQVDIASLPCAASDVFVGRQAELDALDSGLASETCGVFVLVAAGGTGKTALVERWLDRLSEDGWRGLRRVFAWSFYSQGAKDIVAASSDRFFREGLRFFGHEGEPPRDGRDRALRLAELVREPSLLVLDGLEALQHPPGPLNGKLEDHAVAYLLRTLRQATSGLCLVTTRVAIRDLAGQGGAESRRLDHLSEDDGAALLDQIGAQGSLAQRRDASRHVRHHALTLALLGSYIRVALDGDVRRYREANLTDPNLPDAEHAGRVIDAYVTWLAHERTWFGRKKRGAEISLLRLLGVFDRPVQHDVLVALLKKPVIRGLTNGLAGIEGTRLKFAIDSLSKLGLVLGQDASDPSATRSLDAHPLVREHFGARIQTEAPGAWRAGHKRIYEHLRDAAPELPYNAEAAEPLWAAVAHGCKAGRHQEVYDDVYLKRIELMTEVYNQTKLGAFGAALAGIAHFFETSWSEPVASLAPHNRSLLIGRAGFALRALGRLREALGPMLRALELDAAANNWRSAATAATNLSELRLALGDVRDAIVSAEISIEHADKSGDHFLRVVGRTSLAAAFAQAGRYLEAQGRFEEAEQIQAKTDREPRLYSLRGYQFCALLLRGVDAACWLGSAPDDVPDTAACHEVRSRADEALGWSQKTHRLLDLGFDHLTIGRTVLLTWRLDAAAGRFDDLESARLRVEARNHLDIAVEELRKAGMIDYLPLSLLHRATFHRLDGAPELARADLDEVFEIATQSEMRLHLTDAHLGYAWLALTEHSSATAQTHADHADALIQATGYHRRDTELAALSEAIVAAQRRANP